MPRTNITHYALLVSCPGDVTEYIDVIKECVAEFNRTIGTLNNIAIDVKHWSTDTFPQSGDRPQEIINKQLIRDCDLAVALFWTKFGTSTDKYDSGTEEEIAEMLNAGKQVFMYFIDAPISPSKIDSTQNEKVKAYKEEYKKIGVFSTVQNKEDFRIQFTNHMSLYFLTRITEHSDSIEHTEHPKPSIIVQDKTLSSKPEVIVENTLFLDSELLEQKKTECLTILHGLQSSYLSSRTTPAPFLSESDLTKILKNIGAFQSAPLVDAEISSNQKQIISEFAINNGINLNPNFWNVGDLKRSMFSIPQYGEQLEGTDSEKQRYRRMDDLYFAILEYMEYKKFFSAVDSLDAIGLVVTNNGNAYDEDIDIKLTIENAQLIRLEDLPIPGSFIIKDLLDNSFINQAFAIETNDIIAAYPDYPQLNIDYTVRSIQQQLASSDEELYDELKMQYTEEMSSLFCYERHDREGITIIKLHINYLKHHSTIAFPSYLLFNTVPESIKYEIHSKYNPDIVTGEIHVNDG